MLRSIASFAILSLSTVALANPEAEKPTEPTPPVAAETPAEDAKELSFDDLDKDTSGAIDEKEAAALPELSKSFKTVDGDTNGLLSRTEFAAFRKAQQPASTEG